MLKACATSPQHLLCTLQACAVLLTGIGVKLAIYNPFSSPDAPSQRKLFATSISVCFGLQLVMRPLHSGSLLKHYAPRKLLAAPRRALVVVLRLCTVGAMLGLLGAPLSPALFVVAQALLALLENQLSSAEPKPLEDEDDAPPAASTPRRGAPSSTFSSLRMAARSPRASSRAPRLSSRTSSFSGIVVDRRAADVLKRLHMGSSRSSGVGGSSRSRIKAAAARLSPHRAPPPTRQNPSAGGVSTHGPPQKRPWPKPGEDQ
jgi:hypothetical protein